VTIVRRARACDERMMRTLLALLVFVAACKKDPQVDLPPPPHPDPAPTASAAPAGTTATTSAGAIDGKLLVGTWTMADNPKVTWKFGADGSFILNTSALTNNKGTYKLTADSLEVHNDGFSAKTYKVVSVDAHKLTVDDTAFHVKNELKR
jgi:hypothetical protein